MANGMSGHQSAAADTVEWMTPPWLLDALGGADAFDIDPCAPIDAPWPTARQHWTVADNGLIQPWQGRAWVNPPYSTGIIGQFMRKLVEHGQGIALIFARTETAAFHETVWRAADSLLFLEGRLHFHVSHNTTFHQKGKPPIFVKRGDPTPTNAGAPSVLIAYGADDSDALAESKLPGAFVPLRIRALTFGFASVGSWADEVLKVMEGINRPMRVDEIYRALAGSAKCERNPNWKAKIRQTLQRGPFEPQGDAVWTVAEGRLL